MGDGNDENVRKDSIVDAKAQAEAKALEVHELQIKAEIAARRAMFDHHSDDEQKEEWKPAVVNPSKTCRLCGKTFAGWGDICQVCRKIPGGVQQTCKECGAFFHGFKSLCHDCDKVQRASIGIDQDFSITGWHKQTREPKPLDTKPKGYGRYGRDPETGRWMNLPG